MSSAVAWSHEHALCRVLDAVGKGEPDDTELGELVSAVALAFERQDLQARGRGSVGAPW